MHGSANATPFSLIDISCKVSSNPTGGHPYWFHKALAYVAITGAAKITIVGAQEEHSDWVKGFLKYEWSKRAYSSIFTLQYRARESQRISSLIVPDEMGVDATLHFYEGGFREFLLLQDLLWRNPTAKFYFNFNLTDPWHKVFGSKGWKPARRILLASLAKLIMATEERGTYSVETPHLQRLFLNHLGKKLPVYPLFSATLAPPVRQKESRRSVDVTFFPEGSAEALFCLSALEQLRRTTAIYSRFVPRWGYRLDKEFRERASSLDVEIIDAVLGNDEYLDLYRETKVVVFPYLSEYYKVSSSGRYLDAKVGGAIPIAPKDSSLAEDIAESGFGEIFEADTSSLSYAIQVALQKNYPVKPTVFTASDTLRIIQNSVPQEAAAHYPRSRAIFSELAFSALVNTCLGPRLSIGRHLDAFGFARASMGAKALLNVLRKK